MLQDLLNYATGLSSEEKKADVIIWLERRDRQKQLTGQQEAEHIIDFFNSDASPKNFVRMSYEDAQAKAAEWTEKMNKKGDEIKESSSDTEVVLDFLDGFKIVKLIGENAYKREGALMRHCVAGYFGNGKEIYSLRDAKNMPHCTMEKDNQIKGKGNGSIHPKYIGYVVGFLEFCGMKVRDSEMENLGYFVPKFHSYCTNKLFMKRYLSNGTDVKYKEGFEIFSDIKKVQEFDGEACGFDGSVYVRENATFTAPKLTEVSGYVDVRENATFTAPKLTEVSGSVYVRENATFTAPKLTEVSGYVDVRENATFTAPKLTKSGYVDVRENATLNVPAKIIAKAKKRKS